MKVRVCFHDKCFDGASSAAIFSRFYHERIDPSAEFLYTGMTHKASAPFEDGLLRALPEVLAVEHDGQHVVVTGTGELVNAVILALASAGVTARDVQLDSSNLEDAFVKLTGRQQDKEEGATS